MKESILDVLSIKNTAERNAIKWVSENKGMYEMLGTVPDEDIAEKYGCKLNRVRRYRRALGIKFKRGRRGATDSGIPELVPTPTPQLSDVEISSAASILVESARIKLTQKYENKYPGITPMLGILPDQRVGDTYGISRESVRLIRNKFNIPSSKDRDALNALKEKCNLSLDRKTALNLLEIGKFISDNLGIILESAGIMPDAEQQIGEE